LALSETDPDYATSDAMLPALMAHGPPTVLPSCLDDTGGNRAHKRLPSAVLQQAAGDIGHGQVEIDIDGSAP
jgi:hypothetical protein